VRTAAGERGAAIGARRPRLPLLLAAPALAVVALLLAPIVYLAIRAGTGGRDAWEVLARASTARLIGRTLGLAAAVSASSVAIGVPLAWLVTRTDLPARRTWFALASLPLVIPSYVAALALIGAFSPRGLLQQVLEGPFGVERLPEIYGFPGALLAVTLSTVPYVFLLAAAAFRRVDPALEEAARGLGRSRLSTFATVTFPLVRPSVAAGALIAALYAISDFGAVSLMRYDTLTRAIFTQYRSLLEREPAAVLGLLLVAITSAILAVEAWARGRGRIHRTTPGAGRRAAPVPLGRWRWPALAAVAAVVAVLAAVPVAVLGYWLGRGLARGEDLALPVGPAVSSVLVALAAAALALAAALPVAILAQRHRSPWTRSLERASYVSNALPGIVVALALVFFTARYLPVVYQTIPLLLVAYLIRYFPQALAGADGALRSVDPRLEEAARGLGRGSLGVLWSVTLPLMRAGLVSGGTLVVLSVLRELPATLVLRPIGFETLATEVWRETSVGAYSAAAVPALALMLVALPVLYVASRLQAAGEGPAPGS
jgi:iron(III) transport system permease protein